MSNILIRQTSLGLFLFLLLAGCGVTDAVISRGSIAPEPTPPVVVPPPAPPVVPPPPPAPGPKFIMKLDQFDGADGPDKDLLFVVDDSGSMGSEIAAVRAGLDAFVANLQSKRVVDYQVATTTTDALSSTISKYGKLVRSTSGVEVVTSQMANPTLEMADILSNIPLAQTNTSGFEMGLRAAELAITQFGSQFMRPNVQLAVMILSDEEDQSCTAGEGCRGSGGVPVGMQIPISYYANFFKTQANAITVYPIVGLPTDTCANVYSKGPRYLELQRLLGVGMTGSICQNQLDESFQNIARELSGLVCYKLSKVATGSEIQVRVNAAVTPGNSNNGYRFEKESNSICFTGEHVPGEGATIVVNYEAIE